MNQEEMVRKFLCPGCVCGHNTECGQYKEQEPGIGGCSGHVLGTFIMPAPGLIALGMPRGFNRPVSCVSENIRDGKMLIRTYPKGSTWPQYDVFNVPVWVREEEGFLFVRVAMPRIAGWAVDIIEGAHPSDYPEAKDVTSLEYD